VIVRLLRAARAEGWIVGIAVAASLAYVTVRLLEDVVTVLLSVIDGIPAGAFEGAAGGLLGTGYPWSAVINGHLVFFEPLVRSTVLFVVVTTLAALALRATRAVDADA
jgi:hypothetical protein